MAGTLLKAFVIGFSIAAPVGPIGFLCIRRTLVHGSKIGFLSGLGAATADGFYAAVAAFSLTLVSQVFSHYAKQIHLLGGLLLILLGLRIALARAQAESVDAPISKRWLPLRAYVSTFLLTITNPLTIFTFAAVFTIIVPRQGLNYAHATSTVTGVFLGSAAWWLVLSVGVGKFRRFMGSTQMRWINWISGGAITAFGIASLV